MGINTSQHSHVFQQLQKQYAINSVDHEKGIWILKDNNQNNLHLLKSITTGNQMQNREIQRLTKQKKKDDNPYLLRLEDFVHETRNNYCTVFHQYYLVFEHPCKDLRSEMEQRKIQNNSFDEDELMSIIETGTLGLKYLKGINHPLHNLNSQTILLSNTGIILLSDPWLKSENPSLVHQYPAPQQLNIDNKYKYDNNDWVAAGLYSLGITILQMYYLQYMDDIYENKSSINLDLLSVRVENIKYPQVRKIVQQLLSVKRKRLLMIPQMQKYVETTKQQIVLVSAQSNIIHNKLPQSNIPQTGLFPKNLSDKQTIDQTSLQGTNIPESTLDPSKHQIFNYSSSTVFNRKQIHQQYPQSQYQYPSLDSIKQHNYMLNSQQSNKPNVNNSFVFSKNIMSLPQIHFDSHQSNLRNIQNAFQSNTTTISHPKTINNYSIPFNYHSSSVSSLKNNCIPKYIIPETLKRIPIPVANTFHEPIKKLINPTTNINSLGSYPSVVNESYYQQDSIIKPAQNKLLHYLPAQIMHTSAVSQINSQTHKNQIQAYVNQSVRSKQPSELLQCSFRSPIGVIDNQSSIDQGKLLNYEQEAMISRARSDESYLLKQDEDAQNNIEKAFKKQKTLKQQQQQEETQEIKQKQEIIRVQEESSVQIPIKSRYSPFVRQMNSTIVQISDSENKSEGCCQFQSHKSIVSPQSSKISNDSNRYIVQYYGDNTRYQGQKFNGKKHGQGKYFYEDGAYVQGLWRNDQLNGPGKLYDADNKLVYDGQYYNGLFNGFGKVFNVEPTKVQDLLINYTDFGSITTQWLSYQGEIKQQQKHGFGRLVFSNKQQYQGEFIKDKMHGQGEFHKKNGEIIKGIWKDNKLNKVL